MRFDTLKRIPNKNIVLQVAYACFRSPGAVCLAGCVNKANVFGPKFGPKVPWPKARAIRDRILVPSHQPYNQNWPKTGPGSQAQEPETLFSNLKYWASRVDIFPTTFQGKRGWRGLQPGESL